MKKFTLISCIALMSSCSVFKDSKKSKIKTDSLIEIGSTKTVSEIDTSKKQATRKWKLTFEPTNGSALERYTPPSLFPNFGTNDMKEAMQDLQKSYNQLAGKKTPDTNKYFNNGYRLATLELEETMDEQLHKFKTENQRDTITKQASAVVNTNEKEAINPWLVLGSVCIVVLALFLFFKK